MAPPKKDKIQLICEACSKNFSVYPSRLKKHKVRFCSFDCSKTQWSGSNNPNWKGGLVDRNCLFCNKHFQVKQKEVKIGSGKFCSRQCTAKHNGLLLSKKSYENRVVKHCVECKKEIRLKQSHAKRMGTYCSYNCMANGYRKRMAGVNNPNFKDAGYIGSKVSLSRIQLRKDAKKIKTHTAKEWEELKLMYDNKCACCKKSGAKLTKDHIVPITSGGHNGIDNIQPLCKRCNVKKFTKTIRYVHQLKLTI